MTYAEAIQYLYGLQLFGANFGLANTFQLAALAGLPQAKLRFIHVAGTNGKGSTCAMLESIYRAAGLRVGLFTSPHLVSFRERIQVNRQLISEAEVARLVGEVRKSLERRAPARPVTVVPEGSDLELGAPANGPAIQPTLFEVVTVMALKYFAEQKCDLVIWETGLGGRLDATNIVTPLASVITNIGFDHQQWLGDTLAKIATEKAGIIKPGVPVVTATDAPEALAVIEQTAREHNAALTIVTADEFKARLAGTLAPPLLGDHQKLNAVLALATVGVLQEQIPVAEEKAREGLASVNWPGRLQLITQPGGRRILLDGAHNLEGASALRAALAKHFPQTRPVIIFGALGDKQWPEICRTLAPLAAKIFTVPVASERSAQAEELAAAFRSANPAAEISVGQSISEALIASQNEAFVVITGSLYLVGEALERLGHSPAQTGERGLNEWSAAR